MLNEYYETVIKLLCLVGDKDRYNKDIKKKFCMYLFVYERTLNVTKLEHE